MPRSVQEDDACALVPGDLSKSQEQIGQVVGEVAAVGDPLQSIDVEARRERPVRRDREREGPQDAGGSTRAVLPARLGRDAEQRPSPELRHAAVEVDPFGDLRLDRRPALLFGRRPELAQQHRLPHSAQTRDDHRLLGVATCQSRQEYVEACELIVAPHKQRRTGTGVRRIGVQAGIHARAFPSFREFIADS